MKRTKTQKLLISIKARLNHIKNSKHKSSISKGEAWLKKHESNIECKPCQYPTLIDKLDAIITYVILFGGLALFLWVCSLNRIYPY